MTTDPIIAATEASAAPDEGQRVSNRDATRQQIKRLAQEFEALLLTEMLRDMRKSMLDSDRADGGFGAEAMTDTIDVELGRALSRSGGFGLSQVLMRSLERQILTAGGGPQPAGTESSPSTDTAGDTDRADTPDTPAIVAPPAGDRPETRSETSAVEPLRVPSAAVTSAYGWRRDPFTGQTRFHRGIDLAMAYGREVQAAADGRVVFAGDAGGYGNMVVIEHPSGQQTRYAHLSAATVQAGDTIQAGQVVGRVGQSGRATGPHLHFEVVAEGRALDPRRPKSVHSQGD